MGKKRIEPTFKNELSRDGIRQIVTCARAGFPAGQTRQ